MGTHVQIMDGQLVWVVTFLKRKSLFDNKQRHRRRISTYYFLSYIISSQSQGKYWKRTEMKREVISYNKQTKIWIRPFAGRVCLNKRLLMVTHLISLLLEFMRFPWIFVVCCCCLLSRYLNDLHSWISVNYCRLKIWNISQFEFDTTPSHLVLYFLVSDIFCALSRI